MNRVYQNKNGLQMLKKYLNAKGTQSLLIQNSLRNSLRLYILCIKKITISFIFFYVIIGRLLAFEVKVLPEIDFFADKYQRDYIKFSLYDISNNPSLFSQSYNKNVNIYQISSNKNINSIKRYYDPSRTETFNLNLFWNLNLNQKSILSTGVKYGYNYNMNVERSLEKDYYQHYFGITDTTNGDIVYQGPKLWMLYSYKLNNNLTAGISLNYGVERGLKDIFTECETIIRNMDATLGVSYISDSKNSIIGISGRYFNRKSKYEAVKKLIPANVNFWYGFHVYMEENPNTTIRKNDDREGYELGLQFEQKNLIVHGLGVRISGSYGEHNNEMIGGRINNLTPRAFWQRSSYQIIGNLFYNSDKLHGQLYYIMRNSNDWAKPKNYNILTLENDEVQNRFGGILDYKINTTFHLNSGFEISSLKQKYIEYSGNFIFDKTMNSHFFIYGGKFNINAISSLYANGNIGTVEPDFHWQGTEKFDIMGIKLGYKRQFLFGKLDFCFNYLVSAPDNIDQKNKQFGMNIYLQK